MSRSHEIQARYGLISQNPLRLLGQSTGDADALLFSPAQSIHSFESLLNQAHALQTGEREDFIFLGQRQEAATSAVIPYASHQNIIEGGVPSDKLVLLKDHAGLASIVTDRLIFFQFSRMLDNDF